eukprot:g1137.t1
MLLNSTTIRRASSPLSLERPAPILPPLPLSPPAPSHPTNHKNQATLVIERPTTDRSNTENGQRPGALFEVAIVPLLWECISWSTPLRQLAAQHPTARDQRSLRLVTSHTETYKYCVRKPGFDEPVACLCGTASEIPGSTPQCFCSHCSHRRDIGDAPSAAHPPTSPQNSEHNLL